MLLKQIEARDLKSVSRDYGNAFGLSFDTYDDFMDLLDMHSWGSFQFIHAIAASYHYNPFIIIREIGEDLFLIFFLTHVLLR